MVQTRTASSLFVSCAALLMSGAAAQADIGGFNFLNGWTPKVADSAPPISVPNANTVQLSSGGGNLRSIWFNTPQSITQFNASFTYRLSELFNGPVRLAFVVQNDPRGVDAIGNGNTSSFAGITKSVAVVFDFGYSGTVTNVGIGRNGSVTGFEAMTPASAVSRNLNVNIAYSGGSLLTFTAVDSLDSTRSFTRNYVLPESIAATVGSNSAIVGFAAGTNGLTSSMTQTLSNFSFTVPAPSTAALLGFSCVLASRRRR